MRSEIRGKGRSKLERGRKTRGEDISRKQSSQLCHVSLRGQGDEHRTELGDLAVRKLK